VKAHSLIAGMSYKAQIVHLCTTRCPKTDLMGHFLWYIMLCRVLIF